MSEKVDSAAIEEVNKEVTAVIAGTGSKHQPYFKLTDDQQATIGCYAAEQGTVNAICRFKGDFHELLYNCKNFPANNKIMQPQNFPTANDLHYTVYVYQLGFNICMNF